MLIDWLKHGSLVLANSDWLTGSVYSAMRCELTKEFAGAPKIGVGDEKGSIIVL